MFLSLYRIAFVMFIALAIVPQVHADTQPLNEITAGMGEYEKSQIYTAYLAQENANPDTVAMIIDDVANFEDNASFFNTYLTWRDANPNTIAMILEAIAHFNELNKAPLYAAYLRREHADPNTLAMILDAVANFNGPHKAFLYAVYLG